MIHEQQSHFWKKSIWFSLSNTFIIISSFTVRQPDFLCPPSLCYSAAGQNLSCLASHLFWQPDSLICRAGTHKTVFSSCLKGCTVSYRSTSLWLHYCVFLYSQPSNAGLPVRPKQITPWKEEFQKWSEVKILCCFFKVQNTKNMTHEKYS